MFKRNDHIMILRNAKISLIIITCSYIHEKIDNTFMNPSYQKENFDSFNENNM